MDEDEGPKGRPARVGEPVGVVQAGMELSVIVPARNEEAVLPGFLVSVLAQSEPGFALGVEWELIVVNDDSRDGTRGIAERVAAGRRV